MKATSVLVDKEHPLPLVFSISLTMIVLNLAHALLDITVLMVALTPENAPQANTKTRQVNQNAKSVAKATTVLKQASKPQQAPAPRDSTVFWALSSTNPTISHQAESVPKVTTV